MDKATNVLLAIITVALVTTVVARPNSVRVITAGGQAFSNAISSALGRGVSFGS